MNPYYQAAIGADPSTFLDILTSQRLRFAKEYGADEVSGAQVPRVNRDAGTKLKALWAILIVKYVSLADKAWAATTIDPHLEKFSVLTTAALESKVDASGNLAPLEAANFWNGMGEAAVILQALQGTASGADLAVDANYNSLVTMATLPFKAIEETGESLGKGAGKLTSGFLGEIVPYLVVGGGIAAVVWAVSRKRE